MFNRIWYWFNRRRLEANLAEELEDHRARRQVDLERSGLSSSAASHESRRVLGNVTLALEDAREVWSWTLLEHLVRDLRYALRALRREPTFAITAITTVGLAIAVTTTIFGVVHTALWKPLPFAEPDRLAGIYPTAAGARHDRASARELIAWRESSRNFVEIAAFTTSRRRIVRGPGGPESLVTRPVTANFFQTLQASPGIGRWFESSSRAGAAEAVLTDETWRRVFNSDPQVVGRTVLIDDQPHTITGVSAAGFRLDFLNMPDLFVSIDPAAAAPAAERSLWSIGRLADNATLLTADQELKSVADRLAKDLPATNAKRGVRIEDLRASTTGSNWRPLLFFLGTSGFVLLLACTNVASLLLARALKRQRELAVRRALGGGTVALARQLLVEGTLLASLGSALGLLLAMWAVEILPALLPADYIGRDAMIRIDSRVVVFILAVAFLTAIVFGLAPALFTRRLDLNQLMSQGTRTIGSARGQSRARSALVVLEVMLALVLLVGAGLFLNSFVRLAQMPLGFEPRGVLTMRVQVSGPRFEAADAIGGFADRLIERIRTMPGVRSVAVGSDVPLDGGAATRFVDGSNPRPPEGEEPNAVVHSVSPAFFRVLGIQLLGGREFDDHDRPGAERVAIVNLHLASRLFPGASALGRTLELLPGASSPWIPSGPVTIVGVVSNAKSVGLNEVDFNSIYLAFAQHPAPSVHLVLNTSVPPNAIASDIRRTVATVDPTVTVFAVRTMTDFVDGAFRGTRFHVLLSSVFAALATIMAAIGIYGVMSYAIEQRTREFGLRLALGARRRTVLGLAFGQAMQMGIAGTALGLATALIVARLLGNALYLVPRVHDGVLYGVSTSDPLTLSCACVLLILVATLAGLVPALRATRVDPIVALRCE
jgi:putative ABC transport system permease protein